MAKDTFSKKKSKLEGKHQELPFSLNFDDNATANVFNNNLPYSTEYFNILEKKKSLPVREMRDKFLRLVRDNQFVILVGETGSGKTTQIPQYLVQALRPDLNNKLVGCTQPRRVAAMSVARRVAAEMDLTLGEQVGYSIRFEDFTKPGVTFLKYLTDGMLLREAMSDPMLSKYAAIILDEAHERTLATDLLMGLMKLIALKRKNLKIIIMSATLDAAKFQEYFDGAPLLTVSGRTFPVDVFYSKQPEPDYFEAMIRTVNQIHQKESPGDILVFLTGEEEIEEACRRVSNIKGLFPLPLYSSLPPAAQQRIFEKAPSGLCKCIFSTNIAETSLTIDGIVYVIDPGFCKQKVYHPKQRIESLLVSPISKASAKQRSGRAGRTQPGKCFRLYTEESFERDLREASIPEILRTNLCNVILQMKALGVEDLVHFDFIDPPAPESLIRALEILNYLEALDDEGELTLLGKQMSEFPLDPLLAKCLITGSELGVGESILHIVALLSVPPIFVRPNDYKKEADDVKAAFSHHLGDHLTLLCAFKEFLSQPVEDRERWCWDNYLSGRSLKSALDIATQLKFVLDKCRLSYCDKLLASVDKELFIRKSIISGFFSQAAFRVKSNGVYSTLKENAIVKLHPSTSLNEYPEWIIYNELVLTSQHYVRTVSTVHAEWLLDAAPKYFDMKEFPRNEARRCLEEILLRKNRVHK